MILTPEQLAAFDAAPPDPALATGVETPEQARNQAVYGFQVACQFDGIGVPSVDDVLGEMARRHPEPPFLEVRDQDDVRTALIVLDGNGVAQMAEGTERFFDRNVIAHVAWARRHGVEVEDDGHQNVVLRREQGEAYLQAFVNSLRDTGYSYARFYGGD